MLSGKTNIFNILHLNSHGGMSYQTSKFENYFFTCKYSLVSFLQSSCFICEDPQGSSIWNFFAKHISKSRKIFSYPWRVLRFKKNYYYFKCSWCLNFKTDHKSAESSLSASICTLSAFRRRAAGSTSFSSVLIWITWKFDASGSAKGQGISFDVVLS